MPPRNRRPAGQRLVSPPPVRLSGPPPHRLAPSALQQPRRLGLRPRGAPRALGRTLVASAPRRARPGAQPRACRARPAVAARDVPVMNKPAAPWRPLFPPGAALKCMPRCPLARCWSSPDGQRPPYSSRLSRCLAPLAPTASMPPRAMLVVARRAVASKLQPPVPRLAPPAPKALSQPTGPAPCCRSASRPRPSTLHCSLGA